MGLRVHIVRAVAVLLLFSIIVYNFGLTLSTILFIFLVCVLNGFIAVKNNEKAYFVLDFTLAGTIIGLTGGASAGHSIFLPILCLFYSFTNPGLVGKGTSIFVIILSATAAIGDWIFPKLDLLGHSQTTLWDVVTLASSSFLLFYFGSFLARRIHRTEQRIANLVGEIEDIISATPYPLFVFRNGECVFRNLHAEKIEIPAEAILNFETVQTQNQRFRVCRLFSPKQGLQFALLVDLLPKIDHSCHRSDQEPEKLAELAPSLSKLVGSGAVMSKVKSLIARVAPTDATVLLTGESGTGKTLIARTIHELSSRNGKPFVAVDCASIPSELLESELFGSAKGAFTGATDRKGLFLEAHGGTIFLDEIGELTPNLQVKLLQVIQEKVVRPLGKNEYHEVDVRIICATNKNLEEAVKQKLFREDLYFRINVVRVMVPPLRERLDDIPALVRHFLDKRGKGSVQITADAMNLLMSYDYPGNIRELENILERALILSSDGMISADHIQFTQPQTALTQFTKHTSIFELETPLPVDLDNLMNTLESKLILKALEKANYSRIEAAKLLNISQRSLRYRIKKLNLPVSEQS